MEIAKGHQQEAGGAPLPEDQIMRDLIEASRLERAEPGSSAGAAVRPGNSYNMDALLRMMIHMRASDLHIKTGSAPGLRVDGVLEPMDDDVLRPADTRRLVREVLSEQQFERFEMESDLDLSYVLADGHRFRINVLHQRGAMGMVVRHIPAAVPSIKQLGLPPICVDLANKRAGLVLVTGPTGSGKSTTLAALIDHINATRQGHIVTMEDPVEFEHPDRHCYVTQREIGLDARNFPAALRRALRQDPDVIMVGEMRDLETISLAVTAAETGHLVFATLHTTSAIQTVNRIVDVFPPSQQEQIRLQLADNLQGIISQMLVPRHCKRGRVAAMEVLVATGAVRALIRENKPPQLLNLMQTGVKDGQQTLERELNRLVAAGEISIETALSRANNSKQIQIPADQLDQRSAQRVGSRTPVAPQARPPGTPVNPQPAVRPARRRP